MGMSVFTNQDSQFAVDWIKHMKNQLENNRCDLKYLKTNKKMNKWQINRYDMLFYWDTMHMS